MGKLDLVILVCGGRIIKKSLCFLNRHVEFINRFYQVSVFKGCIHLSIRPTVLIGGDSMLSELAYIAKQRSINTTRLGRYKCVLMLFNASKSGMILSISHSVILVV